MLATDRFADLATSCARDAGLEGARIATVAHPIGGVAKEVLIALADRSVDRIMSLLMGRGA